MNMRLLGARNLSEIVPEMVDAIALHSHATLTPKDNLYDLTCEFETPQPCLCF
jgi:L-lactate dehydrogenase (cytochrome)